MEAIPYLDDLFEQLTILSLFIFSLFTILEPENQEIREFYVDQKCWLQDFNPPRLWKGRSDRFRKYFKLG